MAAGGAHEAANTCHSDLGLLSATSTSTRLGFEPDAPASNIKFKLQTANLARDRSLPPVPSISGFRVWSCAVCSNPIRRTRVIGKVLKHVRHSPKHAGSAPPPLQALFLQLQRKAASLAASKPQDSKYLKGMWVVVKIAVLFLDPYSYTAPNI